MKTLTLKNITLPKITKYHNDHWQVFAKAFVEVWGKKKFESMKIEKFVQFDFQIMSDDAQNHVEDKPRIDFILQLVDGTELSGFLADTMPCECCETWKGKMV
jgi:hypothetical protein